MSPVEQIIRQILQRIKNLLNAHYVKRAGQGWHYLYKASNAEKYVLRSKISQYSPIHPILKGKGAVQNSQAYSTQNLSTNYHNYRYKLSRKDRQNVFHI